MKDGDRITVGNVMLDVRAHARSHAGAPHVSRDRRRRRRPSRSRRRPATSSSSATSAVPICSSARRNVKGTMEIGARTLFRSLQRFAARPEWLQIWPGHGAGSACGKGISAIPQSTLGYERRFNWAFQIAGRGEIRRARARRPARAAEVFRRDEAREQATVRAMLGGFRRPAQLDRAALETALRDGQRWWSTRDPPRAMPSGTCRARSTFRSTRSFTTWAGWLVPYTRTSIVIVEQRRSGDRSRGARSRNDRTRSTGRLVRRARDRRLGRRGRATRHDPQIGPDRSARVTRAPRRHARGRARPDGVRGGAHSRRAPHPARLPRGSTRRTAARSANRASMWIGIAIVDRRKPAAEARRGRRYQSCWRHRRLVQGRAAGGDIGA